MQETHQTHSSDTATLCGCGCGVATVRPTARFLSGHDAKLKSALIRSALGGDDTATRELTRLGWSAHLALSQASAARKAKDKVAAAKGKAATKPTPRKVAKPASKPATRKPVPTTEAPAGADGRVPASMGRLAS